MNINAIQVMHSSNIVIKQEQLVKDIVNETIEQLARDFSDMEEIAIQPHVVANIIRINKV